MTRTGTVISVFNLEGQKSIEAAGHQRELEITVNLHGHGRGQGIHMEEVNAIGDPIFNDHALRVATHQLGGGAAELTNQLRRSAPQLVGRYAQRMNIENGIADGIDFFHMDALSSAVAMKVDCDLQLTLMASSLY